MTFQEIDAMSIEIEQEMEAIRIANRNIKIANIFIVSATVGFIVGTIMSIAYYIIGA